MSAAADRNLLFGILALQMDFISRDALIAGMHAWVLDKVRPLGRILLDQKQLAPDVLDLIDALVSKHLVQHGNDAQRSLAALSSLGAARQDLQKLGDGDVQASLAVVAAARPHEDALATRSYSVGESSSAGQRFRILRPHAEGGLGKVSVALDEELRREVALKEIKEKHADDPASRGRFLQEAEITGGLEHPGIVPVYGLGVYADGRPFYAMRFIRGDSLKEAIEQFHKNSNADSAIERRKTLGDNPRNLRLNFSSLDFHRLLRRFIDVCNAIAYAHSRGILHRDLKPGNIMLGKYGETLVVDWGLAKAGIKSQESADGQQGSHEHEPPTSDSPVGNAGSPIDVEQSLKPSGSEYVETVAGTAVGTPAFMSPEQAAGRLDLLGPASDVYSLGATLFQILTGQPPLKNLPTPDILRRVQKGELPAPRQLCPEVPADLEAICRKAMALRPADRYATPRALADDLEHWLADEPVSAWPEPLLVKARRLIGRHRALAASAAAVLVVSAALLLVGNVLLSQANVDLENERQNTLAANENLGKKNEELAKAEAATSIVNAKLKVSEKAALGLAAKEKKAHDETEQALVASNMLLMVVARSRFEEGNARLADEMLEKVPERLRGSPWGLLKNYVAGSVFTLSGHKSTVESVAISPEGRQLASASWDQTIKLWDARTGVDMRTLSGHKGLVTCVSFSPDGQWLASASFDKTIKLWEARTGRCVQTLSGHAQSIKSVAFSPDGKWLASASADRTVKLWDMHAGKLRRTLADHKLSVNGVAFSPDGLWLASASADKTVKLWNVHTGEPVRTFDGHKLSVNGVAFSPDGQWLASASTDKTVMLWDASAGQLLQTLTGHSESIRCVAFSPDGQWLVSAGLDKSVKMWHARTGKLMRTFNGHLAAVHGVAVSPDGQCLFSASADAAVKVWDARPGQELRTVRGHTGLVSSVAASPDGQWLASAAYDLTVKLWNVRTGREWHNLAGHQAFVNSVAFSADGQWLASASADGTVKMWNAQTGQELRTLRGHDNQVTSVAFGPEGAWLVSASLDKTLRLWNARTGEPTRTIPAHSLGVNAVAVSPDGQWLASASLDKTVKLWHTQKGHPLRTLAGHGSFVTGLAISPDGLWLASSSADKTVKLWDARTGQELHTLSGHTAEVKTVAICRDGQWLASASVDGTAKLWDARTGEELRALRGHANFVTGVAISPDDQWLASVSHDGTLKLWDTRTAEPSDTSVKELRFRQWATAPDLHERREQVEKARKDGLAAVAGFHLAWFLAGQADYDDEPRIAAVHAGWLGLAHFTPTALGVAAILKPPAFDRGGVYAGILAKASAPALKRVQAEAARGTTLEPASWQNRVLCGAAWYRAGDYPRALQELNRALELRAKADPNVCLASFLAMTHAKLGQHEQARKWLNQMAASPNAPWEEAALLDLLRPEVEQTLGLTAPNKDTGQDQP